MLMVTLLPIPKTASADWIYSSRSGSEAASYESGTKNILRNVGYAGTTSPDTIQLTNLTFSYGYEFIDGFNPVKDSYELNWDANREFWLKPTLSGSGGKISVFLKNIETGELIEGIGDFDSGEQVNIIFPTLESPDAYCLIEIQVKESTDAVLKTYRLEVRYFDEGFGGDGPSESEIPSVFAEVEDDVIYAFFEDLQTDYDPVTEEEKEFDELYTDIEEAFVVTDGESSVKSRLTVDEVSVIENNHLLFMEGGSILKLKLSHSVINGRNVSLEYIPSKVENKLMHRFGDESELEGFKINVMDMTNPEFIKGEVEDGKIVLSFDEPLVYRFNSLEFEIPSLSIFVNDVNQPFTAMVNEENPKQLLLEWDDKDVNLDDATIKVTYEDLNTQLKHIVDEMIGDSEFPPIFGEQLSEEHPKLIDIINVLIFIDSEVDIFNQVDYLIMDEFDFTSEFPVPFVKDEECFDPSEDVENPEELPFCAKLGNIAKSFEWTNTSKSEDIKAEGPEEVFNPNDNICSEEESEEPTPVERILRSNKDAYLYLAPKSAKIISQQQLADLVADGLAVSPGNLIKAGDDGIVDVSVLPEGVYKTYAVDSEGLVSKPSVGTFSVVRLYKISTPTPTANGTFASVSVQLYANISDAAQATCSDKIEAMVPGDKYVVFQLMKGPKDDSKSSFPVDVKLIKVDGRLDEYIAKFEKLTESGYWVKVMVIGTMNMKDKNRSGTSVVDPSTNTVK